MFTDEQFTRLAKTYIDTVFRVALNYLNSGTDADDVTQNVFLIILLSASTLYKNAPFCYNSTDNSL